MAYITSLHEHYMNITMANRKELIDNMATREGPSSTLRTSWKPWALEEWVTLLEISLATVGFFAAKKFFKLYFLFITFMIITLMIITFMITA